MSTMRGKLGCAEHLWNGGELVVLCLVSRDHSIHRCHGLRAVRVEGDVSAVMHKDDIATTDAARDPLLDVIGRWRVPVVSRDIPHDRFEPEIADQAKDPWPAPAPGRAK